MVRRLRTTICVLILALIAITKCGRATTAPVIGAQQVGSNSSPSQVIAAGNAVSQEPRLSLEFRDASIDSVLQLLSMASGKTVIKDPAVSGSISMLGKRDVPLSEAMEILAGVLKLRGVVLRSANDIIEVLPQSRAQALSQVVVQGEALPEGSRLVTYILPLRGMDAVALRTQLAPLFTGDACIAASSETNTLVITDFADHVSRITEVVNALQRNYEAVQAVRRAEQGARVAEESRPRAQLPDRLADGKRDLPQIEVLRLQYADARTLAGEIRQILRDPAPTTTSSGVSGQILQRVRTSGVDAREAERLLRDLVAQAQDSRSPEVGAAGSAIPIVENRVVADTHTNSLIITGSTLVVRAVADLVGKLDVDVRQTRPVYDMQVISLRNADPRLVAQLLNDMALQVVRRLSPGDSAGAPRGEVGQLSRLRTQIEAMADSSRLRNLSPQERQQLMAQLRRLRGDGGGAIAEAPALVSPMMEDHQGGTLLTRGEYFAAADTVSRSVVVIGERSVMEEILALVEELDRSPQPATTALEIIRLENASPSAVAAALNQVVSARRSVGASGQMASQARALPVASSQDLIVIGSEEEVRELVELAEKLDLTAAGQRVSVVLIQLQQADAQNLAEVINQCFAGGRTGAPAIRASEQQRTLVQAQGMVRAVAEPGTNSLLVTAPEEVMGEIRHLVADLDREDLLPGVVVRLLPLQHAAAQTLSATLNQFYAGAASMVPSTGSRGRSVAAIPKARFAAQPSGNILLLAVAAEAEAEVTELVLSLDQAAEEAQVEMVSWVHVLQFAEASNVANVVNQFLQGAMPVGVPSPVQSSAAQQLLAQLRDRAALAEQQRSGAQRVSSQNGAAASASRQVVQGPAVARTAASGPSASYAVLVADSRTNRILASLPKESEELVRSLLSELDQPSLSGEYVTRQYRLVETTASAAAQTINQFYAQTALDSQGKVVLSGRGATGAQAIQVRAVAGPSGDTLFVLVPVAIATQVDELVVGLDQLSSGPDPIVSWVHELRFADAPNLAQVLTTYLRGTAVSMASSQAQASIAGSQKVWIVAEPASRRLLISVPQTLELQVRSLLLELDREDVASRYTVDSLRLDHADAVGLAQALNQIYQGLSFASGPVLRFVAEADSNSLLVLGPETELDRVLKFAVQFDRPLGVRTEVRTVSLAHTEASQVVAALTELLPSAGRSSAGPEARFVADKATNSVLLVGFGEELSFLEEVIRRLDNAPVTSMLRQVELVYASASSVASLLNQLYQSRGSTGRFGAVEVRAVADFSTNRLMLLGPPYLLEEMEKVARDLDQPAAATTSGNVTVYRVRNARATELANVLNSLFTSSGQATSSRTSAFEERLASAGRLGAQHQAGTAPLDSTGVEGGKAEAYNAALRANVLPTQEQPSLSPDYGVNLAYESVRVIADPASNTLLIIGPPEVIPDVQSLVTYLDVMPPQVLVEAIVVELGLDSNRDMGIQWKWSTPPNSDIEAGSAVIGLGNMAGALGGRYSVLSQGLEFVLSLLSGDSSMKVISTPRILAANDTPAIINIVTQIPYAQSEKKEGNVVTTTYAYKDVGVTLRVTPRIGDSGQVYLDLYQTTDSFTQETISGRPVINTRETQSTLVVEDGQTLVIGGLIRDNVSVATHKIPFLGDLPIVGRFFRTEKSVSSKTELVVFVRPTIVRTQADAASVTERQSSRIGRLSEILQQVDGVTP